MKISRRDLLLGAAGAAAGLALSPVPWKLLSDVSIWTQNFPWIPQPARGPVETKYTACTLCERGCGMRIRLAAKWAVGVAGASSHPLSKGALCPLAFAAHQLNWHPQRLREVRHAGRTSTWAAAQAAFTKACAEGPVVIVDGRPGRAASSVFAAFCAKHGGTHQSLSSAESRALTPYAEWSGVPATSLGYDLEHARTIVSFGAPMLDGWGTPGRFSRLWSERAAGAADPQLRLIQIEPALSRTASRAWQWVPIKEGGQSALAAGLARVLLEERLVPARGPVPALALKEAADRTGLSPNSIRDLARSIVETPPTVAIVGGREPGVAALNVLLGAVDAPGGIVTRSLEPRTATAGGSPGGPVRAALVDATAPWDYAAPAGAEVFRFAAWDGGGNGTDWLLPAPGFLEELTDVPTPPTAGAPLYAVAQNLVPMPPAVQSATQFLRQIDPTLPEVDKLIHTRCEDIFRSRQGTLFGEQTTEVAKIASAQHLEEQLRLGAVWMGSPPKAGTFRCELKSWPEDASVAPTAEWDEAWVPPVLPPLASKLYQESNLRVPPAGRQA